MLLEPSTMNSDGRRFAAMGGGLYVPSGRSELRRAHAPLQLPGPEDQVLRHLDVARRRNDADLFDLGSGGVELFADRVELAVPGLLDLGDTLDVIDLAHALGVRHARRFAAGDVVERLAPGHVDLVRDVGT